MAAFHWNLCFFKYFRVFSYVSVYAMYFICKFNDSKILALVVTLKLEKVYACTYVTFSRARAYTLYSATTVLTI